MLITSVHYTFKYNFQSNTTKFASSKCDRQEVLMDAISCQGVNRFAFALHPLMLKEQNTHQ